MTDQNYTHIELIVDASGSMHHLTDDTVKGIHSLLNDQRKLDGRVTVSYTTFDTWARSQFSMRPLNEVSEIAYAAGGGTALLDAVGAGIRNLGRALRDMPESQRPASVVVPIITDGEENSSKAFTRAQIKELITEHQDRYSWVFLFMGANIDSFAEAGSLGISGTTTMDWNAAHIGGTYAAASSSIMRGRVAASQGVSGQSLMASYNFTQDERDEASGETDPNTP